MSDPHLPSDTEIVISRVLHAPRELVWEAWTNPKHVVNWWGPRGFTNTTKRHEFRVGGYWEHMMHGPDGTNYPNKAKFLEIVPLERIVFLLGGGSDLEADERRGATFRATWTFESVEGNKTRLTGRMVFPSKEARDRVVRDFGAIQGGKQTLERLAEHLPFMRSQPFIISREFKAPRELLWRVWTEPQHLQVWLGAKGTTTTFPKFELRPGGIQHHCMTTADGQQMWGRADYREIEPPAKLVWLTSFSDAAGNIVSHPLAPTWPRQMYSRADFSEKDGRTTVTIIWLPFDASEEEWATFEAQRAGMTQGWSGMFDQLTAYLSANP